MNILLTGAVQLKTSKRRSKKKSIPENDSPIKTLLLISGSSSRGSTPPTLA